MELKLFLFCNEYYFNVEVDHDTDIHKHIKRYRELLGTNESEGLYYRRKYNYFKKNYLDQLEQNIKYCQNKLSWNMFVTDKNKVVKL